MSRFSRPQSLNIYCQTRQQTSACVPGLALQISLLRQLVFGLTAAKFVLAKTTSDSDIPVAVADNLMTRLRETFPALLEAMPEDQRGQIKATPEVCTCRHEFVPPGVELACHFF